MNIISYQEKKKLITDAGNATAIDKAMTIDIMKSFVNVLAGKYLSEKEIEGVFLASRLRFGAISIAEELSTKIINRYKKDLEDIRFCLSKTRK